jgi:hypothetical protein
MKSKILQLEPNRAIPKIEMLLPILTADLKLMTDPSWNQSSTDSELPATVIP